MRTVPADELGEPCRHRAGTPSLCPVLLVAQARSTTIPRLTPNVKKGQTHPASRAQPGSSNPSSARLGPSRSRQGARLVKWRGRAWRARTARRQLRALGLLRAEWNSVLLFLVTSGKTHSPLPHFPHENKTRTVSKVRPGISTENPHSASPSASPNARQTWAAVLAVPAGCFNRHLCLSQEVGKSWAESWFLAHAGPMVGHQRAEARGACCCLQVKPACWGGKPGLRRGHAPRGGPSTGPGLLTSCFGPCRRSRGSDSGQLG